MARDATHCIKIILFYMPKIHGLAVGDCTESEVLDDVVDDPN
jgi:hypothetical protein